MCWDIPIFSAVCFQTALPHLSSDVHLSASVHISSAVHVKKAPTAREKMNKKEVFKLAKGFRGRAKNCIRVARERVEKALQYSYRDRRNKKRDMRSLWIQRINAGTRQHGVNYGNFMHGLMEENIQLNRKVLSELSMHEPYTFKALVDISSGAFPGNKTSVLPPKKEGLSLLL